MLPTPKPTRAVLVLRDLCRSAQPLSRRSTGAALLRCGGRHSAALTRLPRGASGLCDPAYEGLHGGLGAALWVRAASSAASSPPGSSSLPKSGSDSDSEGHDLTEEQEGKANEIAAMLKADPALCAIVAANMNSRTAARLALTFSNATGAKADSLDDDPTPTGLRNVERPSQRQLWKLFIRTAIPFVGFGFFDNVIMLTVGETLDCTLGVTFGFSTLAAAGMGQMVSDACGITLQGLIEGASDKLGLPRANLTQAQHKLPFVAYWKIGSRIVGIVVGCAMGMFPLLLIPNRYPRLVDQIAEKLGPQARTEFQSLVVTETFKKGDKLLRFAEKSDKVFMIQSGTLEVIGRDLEGNSFTVCTMGQGQTFGKPALDKPSRVDLIADDQVVVQVINKNDFLRIARTGDTDEVMQMLEDSRSEKIKVYQATQGEHFGELAPRKGTGKTRMFAAMSQEDRMQVLSFIRTKNGQPAFSGIEGEGKVQFFSRLTEEQKCDALQSWQSWQDQQR